MIVELPDKNMVVEFPDDMDPAEVERQIYSKVYNQDVISEAPKQSLLEKGTQLLGDMANKALGAFGSSPEEKTFENYGPYNQQEQPQPAQIETPETLQGNEPLPAIASPYEAYTKPYDAQGRPIVSDEEQSRVNTEKELLDSIPSERARQQILEHAKKIKPDQEPGKTVLAYAPLIAVNATRGVMSIALPALKTMGMDTENLLNVASEYWKDRVPSVNIPNAGIGKGKDGDWEIQQIDDYPLADIIGGTAEMSGYMAPMSAALKAGDLVAKTAVGARPFFQSILKGMVGGSLLGEGKKDETLMNMALFGVLEGAGYAVVKSIDSAGKAMRYTPKERAEIITNTAQNILHKTGYYKATIKERGLVLQDLETTLKNNPKMSEADLVKASDSYFKQAMERRKVPEGTQKPAATGEQAFTAEAPKGVVEPVQPVDVKQPVSPVEAMAEVPKPGKIDISKTLSEESFSVKNAVEKKYKDIMDLPESNLGHTVYTKIVDGNMTPEALQKFIERSKDPEIIAEVRAAIADMTGDLQETYRYESAAEGRDIESYMDSLLEVANVPGEPAKPVADRRIDAEKRKLVSELTPEEMRVELLTDYDTGLGNKRAYGESVKKKYFTSMDVDGLKWANDNLGHDVGDELLKVAGEALKQPGLEAYHPSGDEYWAQHDSKESLDLAMKKADDYLRANPIDVVMKDGTKKSFTGSFSYGTARTVKEAERALGKHKADRELSGERYTRGSEPTGFLKDRPEGNEDIPQGKATQNTVAKTAPKTFAKSKPTDKIVKKATPKIVDEIKVTGGKDKTVKVDIPKKEAEGLKPAEQKKYLLAEIETAIKKAPDVAARETTDKVKFVIPGDGEFNLINSKQSLIQFKKKMSGFPASSIIKSSTKKGVNLKPSNKRVTGFPGESALKYKPQSVSKLPELAKDKKSAGFYTNGFYSDGRFIMKTEKPKTNRPLEAFPQESYIGDIVNKKDSELYSATIGTEYFSNPTGDAINDESSVHIYSDDMPTVKGYKTEVVLSPVYLDNIFKKYPEAKPFMEKDGPVYFKDGNEIIAAVMPIKMDVPGPAAEARKAATKKQPSKDVKKQETFYSKEEPTTRPAERVKHEKPLITEAQQKSAKKKKEVKEAQLKIESAKEQKEGVHSMVRQRRYNLNLSSYETNLFINGIEKVTTREQREIIPFIIEKTSVPKELNRPDLEAAYKKDSENLKGIAAQVQEHFDAGWKKYKEHIGDMSAQEIENYVTHIWEIPRSKKQEVTNWFTTKNRFAKQRYIETLEKGIKELGLKPKVLDIGEIIRIHDSATNKAIENKKLVDDLMKLRKDGVPLIERIDKAPPDWVLINHPALNKAVFIPGESKMGEKISPELENILYEMGVAIGRRISPVVFGKPSKVAGLYKTGEPPEVRFQRFMRTKTIAHEIGHHIDTTLGLGDDFLQKHKTELYALNKERIEKSGLDPSYTTKSSEQIAEAFAFLFTDPKMMTKVAPTVMTDMLDRLKKDGVMSKLIDFDFEKKAKNIIEDQLNTLTKLPVRVHPDLVRPLRVVFESADPGAIMAGYDMIAGVLKKTTLSFSLFHHLTLGETGVATTSLAKVAGVYFNPVKIYNALVKGEYDVFKKEDLAKDAIGHGLQLGATSDIPVQKIQRVLNDFAAKTKSIPIAGRVTEFLRTFNEKWDQALWDYLHDTLKLYGYESLVAKNINPAKDVKKQKEDIAQFVNDTFGGQNWDVLMVSPKEVQLMTRALLSADWTISTVRQALSPTGLGTIHKENKKLRKKMGRMFWIKAAIYFGGGINILNYTFREADKKENPEYYKGIDTDVLSGTMAGNAIGHKTHLFVGRYEDGTERYIRWGKQFRELPEMFMDDTGFSPVSASIKKIGGKANPVAQLISQLATGHTLSGFKNDDIYQKEGWDKTWGIAKTLLKSPLPFSSRTLLTPNKEFHITDIAMPSSKGMSRYKVMTLFKTAIIKKDERLLKEIYQDALQNNLPAYTLFNGAITALKAEETREYNKTIKTLEDLKNHEPVKTPKEAAVLKNKIKRLIKEKIDMKIGLGMLDKAIMEAKIYDIEKGD